MMKYFLLLLLVLCTTVSCDKQKDLSPVLLEGTYTGEFVRISPVSDYFPAAVTLTLENGQFSGAGESPRYPAICRGTYSVSGKEIDFHNECFFTADFDWSFVLNGKFSVTMEGENIILTRAQGGGTTDRYTLKKIN